MDDFEEEKNFEGKILNFNKSEDMQRSFLFRLIVWRTVVSIIRGEYKSFIGPLNPGIELVKCRFNMSTIYGHRILDHLITEGIVIFVPSFKLIK